MWVRPWPGRGSARSRLRGNSQSVSTSRSQYLETDLPAQRFPVVVSDPADHASLTELAGRYDAVFAQRLPLHAMSASADERDTRV